MGEAGTKTADLLSLQNKLELPYKEDHGENTVVCMFNKDRGLSVFAMGYYGLGHRFGGGVELEGL